MLHVNTEVQRLIKIPFISTVYTNILCQLLYFRETTKAYLHDYYGKVKSKQSVH